MKKTILSSVSNVLFVFIFTFFLVSILSAKSFSHPVNLLFGLYVGLIVLLFSIIIAKSRLKKQKQKLTLKENENRVIYALNFMSKKKGLAVLYSQIVKLDASAKLCQNKILLSNGESVYNLFSFLPVTKADLVRCFNLSNAKKSVIYCEKAEKEVKDFARAFKGKIVIKERAEFFKEFPPENFVLEDNFTPIDFNKKDKPKLRVLLNKKNAKKFIAFGLFFILLSFFAPIKLYYIITGGIMILYAVTVLFFSKTES